MKNKLTIPKKWRELPKKDRLNIPLKLGINQKELNKIRNIKAPKKRIIEAAKIQHKKFSTVHSYLTAWVAGYASDTSIRQYFGSTRGLMKKISNIYKDKPENHSWSDFKRSIKIPKEIDHHLAEETGIHIGDGNLYVFKSKEGFHSYKYNISGNYTDEKDYHQTHIQKLLKTLYNQRGSYSIRTEKNCINTILKSKAVVTFKNKFLNLPIGRKDNIKIPPQIMKNKKLQKACVRGLIDTDFTISAHMQVIGSLKSITTIKQISQILKNHKIQHNTTYKEKYGKIYVPKKEAKKILENWNLANKKHTSKYAVWKKFKTYFPFSTTQERLDLLEGKSNCSLLKKICKKRSLSQKNVSR